MKIKYSSIKVKDICTDHIKAKKYFDGNEILARSLLSRINALANAEVLTDIIVQPQLRFHKLYNKGKGKNYEGYYAIDVKTIREKWRIILQPLDENENEYENFEVDKMAKNVKIIEVKEVSSHYE